MNQDAVEIENYLIQTVKIGSTAAKVYSVKFVEKGVDSITVMQTLDQQTLRNIMKEIGVSDVHQTLIIKSLSVPSPTDSSSVVNEEKRRQVEEAKKESEALRKQAEQQRDSFSATTLADLNKALSKVSNNDETWKVTAMKTDDLLKELDSIDAKLDVVEQSCTQGSYANNAELINGISGGIVCNALHFVTNSMFGCRGSRKFLDFNKSFKQYGDITMDNNAHYTTSDFKFTSTAEYSIYEKLRTTGGSTSSLNASVAGFYSGVVGAASLSHSNSHQSEETSVDAEQKTISNAVRVKNSNVQINSFSMSPDRFVLSDGAKEAFMSIETEDQADLFLQEFGTHVLLTSQVTGGIYSLVFDVKFTQSVNNNQLDSAIQKADETSGSLILGFGLFGGDFGGANNSTSSSATHDEKLSSGEEYSYSLRLETLGPQVYDEMTFKAVLGTSSKTHCLISNGFNLEDKSTWVFRSVWEISDSLLGHTTESNRIATLLRNAWLKKVLLNKKPQSIEPFMEYVIDGCLKNKLAHDDPLWYKDWRALLEICRFKPNITFVMGKSQVTYTEESIGAKKEVMFLDRQPVKVPEDSVLLGFQLQLHNDETMNYAIFSAKPQVNAVNENGDIDAHLKEMKVTIGNIEEERTEWTNGDTAICLLDRHNIKPRRENCVLLEFKLEREEGIIRYVYKTAQLLLNGNVIPLVDENHHATSWDVGAAQETCCFLERHKVCVPDGRVLTSFTVKTQTGSFLRYEYTSRKLGEISLNSSEKVANKIE